MAGTKIKKVQKGEAPTLMHTSKANELIDAINAFLTLKFLPSGFATLTVNGDSATLDLKGSMLDDMIVVLNGSGFETDLVTSGRLEAL